MNLQERMVFLKRQFIDNPFTKWEDESLLQMIAVCLFKIEEHLREFIGKDIDEVISMEMKNFASKICDKLEDEFDKNRK